MIAGQLDAFTAPADRARTPQPFGKWSRLTSPGTAWQDRLDRVTFWLADRGVSALRKDLLAVVAHCDSGAEVVIALTFAPVRDVEVLDERTLRHGGDTLRVQAPVPHTRYVADFEWTHPKGSALVEVYGYNAHRDRRDSDRVRHHVITGLGYGLHYLPAELIVHHAAGAWPALRQHETERLQRLARLAHATGRL